MKIWYIFKFLFHFFMVKLQLISVYRFRFITQKFITDKKYKNIAQGITIFWGMKHGRWIFTYFSTLIIWHPTLHSIISYVIFHHFQQLFFEEFQSIFVGVKIVLESIWVWLQGQKITCLKSHRILPSEGQE